MVLVVAVDGDTAGCGAGGPLVSLVPLAVWLPFRMFRSCLVVTVSNQNFSAPKAFILPYASARISSMISSAYTFMSANVFTW